MEQVCCIETPCGQGDPDGVEFFQQYTSPHAVATHTHLHESIELLYIREGSYIAYSDGKELALRPGDVILFRPHSAHYIVANDSPVNSYYVIKLLPIALLKLSGNREEADYILRFIGHRSGRTALWTDAQLKTQTEIASALQSLISAYKTNTPDRHLVIKLKVIELLLWIMRFDDANSFEERNNEVYTHIYRAMAYVQTHFSENIDEKQLAGSLGMSYSYFSRSFHKVTGHRFRQYLNTVRINHAEQMLLTTTHSVTMIASLCGYNNASYFASVYRQLKGKPPRRSLQAGEPE